MEDRSRPGRLVRALPRLVAASACLAGAAVHIAADADAAPSAPVGVGPAEQTAAGGYDYDGDGIDDVVARRDELGTLELWPGDGSGGLGPPSTIGPGWNAMDLIETAGDLNDDGRADLIARDADTGGLYFYPGNGDGFDERTLIGRGWEAMSAIVAGHDYDGDGDADLIATEAATGTLWLYPGTGTGTHGRRSANGSDFDDVRELTAVGDLDEDGHADVVGVDVFDECMDFYAGPATGRFRPAVMFDCGWDVMESAAAVGDFDGDGHADWLGRESDTGLLYLFQGDGTGRYSASPVIDRGWDTMTIA